MLLIKSQNKADIDKTQRHYWWAKTPQERLAAAKELIRRGRLLYAANPNNAPLSLPDGARLFKATALRRGRG